MTGWHPGWCTLPSRRAADGGPTQPAELPSSAPRWPCSRRTTEASGPVNRASIGRRAMGIAGARRQWRKADTSQSDVAGWNWQANWLDPTCILAASEGAALPPGPSPGSHLARSCRQCQAVGVAHICEKCIQHLVARAQRAHAFECGTRHQLGMHGSHSRAMHLCTPASWHSPAARELKRLFGRSVAGREQQVVSAMPSSACDQGPPEAAGDALLPSAPVLHPG